MDTSVTNPQETLQFNGERFVPGAGVEIAYEHFSRYIFAAQFCQDKAVLDCACGEGYGSAMLATVAGTVTAFDLGENAISHAKARYNDADNLSFQQASIEEFFARHAGKKYDVITAMEIIEHVDDLAQKKFMAHIASALKDDGMAIISTPDKRVYTDTTLQANRFHVREFHREEFGSFLKQYFPEVVLLEQSNFSGSAIFKAGSTQSLVGTLGWLDLIKLKATARTGLHGEGQYIVALVSNKKGVVGEREERSVVLADFARKDIGERLFNLERERSIGMERERTLMDRVRELEQAKKTLSAQIAQANAQSKDEPQSSAQNSDGLLDALLQIMAKDRDTVAEARVMRRELAALRAAFHNTKYELAHQRAVNQGLHDMLSIRMVLKAKRVWDRFPRAKRVGKSMLKRVARVVRR